MTTWTNPADGGTLDLASGTIVTETHWDNLRRDLLVLGGVAGTITQTGLATGTTANALTTSLVYVDAAELTVTLITTGGEIIAFASDTLAGDTAFAIGTIALSLDGAAEVAPSSHGAGQANSSERAACVCVYRWTGVAAGSHTIKVRKKTTAGTLYESAQDRVLLVVELKK
ncbi:MAG TPA: hypothetical protein VNM48_01595 [Chloroflexota bacterium]|nr:hypothetical protein [Chloroflexota bacterium]